VTLALEVSRESLQELVTLRLAELDLSLRAAAARTNGGLSYETLRNLSRGRHRGVVSDRVAQGLATALSVPVSRVYSAMGVQAPPPRWELPEELHRLPEAFRSSVEDYGRRLMDAIEHGRHERG